MNHDISQSVSQGSNGAQDEKNSRIAAIANELERLCSIHEAQFGNSQQNVSRLDAEQRAAEQMAKSQGYWIPMMDVFNLGVPGPSGNENIPFFQIPLIPFMALQGLMGAPFNLLSSSQE